MIWVPVVAIGVLFLLAPCILAIGAWVRAQDAQERLRLYEKRIAELEARAGISRAHAPALRGAAGAPVASAAEHGAAIEERIALVWFSRIGLAVMLLGAAWFLFSPLESGGGRAARVAVGAGAGLGVLALAELGRERTRRAYNHVLLAMGLALLIAVAFAASAYGLLAAPGAYAAFAAVALLGAAAAARHRAEAPLALAILGALAAPLLVRGGAPHAVALPWVALLGGALTTLAGRLGQPWAAASGIGGTGALLALWLATSYRGSPAERLAIAAAAALLLAAHLAGARLARARDARAAWPVAMLLGALVLAHLAVAAALSAAPAALAAACGVLGAIAAAALHRERRPALLAIPLAVAAAALAGPAIQLASHRGATALALAAWAAVYVAALLWPLRGERAPTRIATGVAAAAAVLFLLIAGGVLAPHAPRWFALVLAAHAAAQVALARRHGALLLTAPAALFGFGGLVGAALHAAGSGDPGFLAGAAAWALAFVGDAAERSRRGEPGWVELAAACAAAAGLAIAAAIVVPASAPALRGLALALPGAAPVALGLALRDRRPRGAPALLAAGLALGGAGVVVGAGSAAATVAWAACAASLVVFGFAAGSPLARRLGLGVFAAALAKLALWDVWRLARGYQVGVLVAVGGLLLAASYLYARRGARPATAREPSAGATPPTAA
jgi:hypothetical protein